MGVPKIEFESIAKSKSKMTVSDNRKPEDIVKVLGFLHGLLPCSRFYISNNLSIRKGKFVLNKRG